LSNTRSASFTDSASGNAAATSGAIGTITTSPLKAACVFASDASGHVVLRAHGVLKLRGFSRLRRHIVRSVWAILR
jgi:hypothetical protein